MKLEVLLQQQGIAYERHAHPLAYTAQELANAEHVSGYLVAKPVVVRGAAGYTMCVVAAPKRVDLQRVADVLHEPNVRLASESEMTGLFPDCEIGAEPPVGVLFGLKTVMDTQLTQDEYLVMQAGTHTDALKMRRQDWERLCTPVVAAIAAG